MPQPLAPAVQQLIAQNPQLAQQAAIRAFELQNQRNAMAYQGLDAFAQNILRGLGMYDAMQERDAAREERQKNRAEDVKFRKEKFEHEKYVQLEKLRLDGSLSNAQIAQLEASAELSGENANRLRQLTPSEVRQREAAADLAENEVSEYEQSADYREAKRQWDLKQASVNFRGAEQDIDLKGKREEREAGLYRGEVERQRQENALGEQQVRRGQMALNREERLAWAMQNMDLTTPEGREAAIPAIAEAYPDMLPGLIQNDQAAIARLNQMQSAAKADSEARSAAALDPVAVEAGVREKVSKALDAAKKSLVATQSKPSSEFSVPGLKEKEEVELTELVKVYERMLLKLDNPELYNKGVPAETVFSRLMVQEWGTTPESGSTGDDGKDALGNLLDKD